MSFIALKVDVDTYEGTRRGIPRLVALFEQLKVRATFLLSLGPDHTGRAVRRVFRRGFVSKVRRTSVLEHYGLKTLLYGTVLPGPHIARECRDVMMDLARRGFEVGVHAYDHVKWQDHVSAASLEWTRRELERAREQFVDLFARMPQVHGAAGWQINAHVPALERALGFRFASDARGEHPFVPVVGGRAGVPQLPTTLPTLDELIGRTDLAGTTPMDHLLQLTTAEPERPHVFTMHAELEGGAFLGTLEQLLRHWQSHGRQLGSLSDYYETLDIAKLPHCELVAGEVAGRAGTLTCQGPPGIVCDTPRTAGEIGNATASADTTRWVSPSAAQAIARKRQMFEEIARLQAAHDPLSIHFGAHEDDWLSYEDDWLPYEE